MNEHQEIMNEIYTPFSLLKAEMQSRYADPELQKKVRDFWAENPFPYNFDEPRAMLSREVITPNRELKYFLELANGLDAKPLFLEYPEGKFVAKNKGKYALCKLAFLPGADDPAESCKIVDFNTWEGKRLSDVQTTWSQPLVDTHRELLTEEYPAMSGNVVDISEWFNKTRGLGEDYYLHFLSLFICHGVLFDNYLLSDDAENEFFFEKILPSFRKAKELFGVRPLIFPLLPIEHERDPHWYAYDSRHKEAIKKNMLH